MSYISFFLLIFLLLSTAGTSPTEFDCFRCEAVHELCVKEKIPKLKIKDHRSGLEIIAEGMIEKMIEKTRVKYETDQEIMEQVKKDKVVFDPTFTYKWCNYTLDAERFLFVRLSSTKMNRPFPRFWQESGWTRFDRFIKTTIFISMNPHEEYMLKFDGRKISIASGRRLVENCVKKTGEIEL